MTINRHGCYAEAYQGKIVVSCVNDVHKRLGDFPAINTTNLSGLEYEMHTKVIARECNACGSKRFFSDGLDRRGLAREARVLQLAHMRHKRRGGQPAQTSTLVRLPRPQMLGTRIAALLNQLGVLGGYIRILRRLHGRPLSHSNNSNRQWVAHSRLA